MAEPLEQIDIDYGVILPTWPEATMVVKPVGENRLLVFVGTLKETEEVPAKVVVQTNEELSE